MPIQDPFQWSPERLAYWYFRLNGFLTIENFIVHPDRGSNQRTDADLLAVRLAHRSENLEKPMRDDARIAANSTFVNVIIAEVKTGQCTLNGPWTNPGEENMRRVLKAIGCVSDSALDLAAEALYEKGSWADAFVTVRLFALGESRADDLLIPTMQQITWSELVGFVVDRFKAYSRQKASTGQWTEDGEALKQASLRGSESEIRQLFGLRNGSVLKGRAVQ